MRRCATRVRPTSALVKHWLQYSTVSILRYAPSARAVHPPRRGPAHERLDILINNAAQTAATALRPGSIVTCRSSSSKRLAELPADAQVLLEGSAALPASCACCRRAGPPRSARPTWRSEGSWASAFDSSAALSQRAALAGARGQCHPGVPLPRRQARRRPPAGRSAGGEHLAADPWLRSRPPRCSRCTW